MSCSFGNGVSCRDHLRGSQGLEQGVGESRGSYETWLRPVGPTQDLLKLYRLASQNSVVFLNAPRWFLCTLKFQNFPQVPWSAFTVCINQEPFEATASDTMSWQHPKTEEREELAGWLSFYLGVIFFWKPFGRFVFISHWPEVGHMAIH